ncbi:alpha/beta hydrolase [Mycolicibacterium smegmatis]|uniref:alpha/beta fold hydrolase n=1 Tax=Mycolicibacterium smegmatis TaxID=1772 RepID=UPI0005D899F3|nr:alpha/beta hydrolase [Mycolicibacterium smegmatis]MDF1897588.1 alpha/beta hydrolase [Mycolicibacterium smegmatis]MDF1903969.1 alpha/beta hydrolase [Mycolicibacterium smegmatis]MDF1917154.1 alpha/beta hydrolase [Mycolicibacterium smegmatis]MDF1922528.1 alpha/beta hydrolase [Mycolicibacterium smegmatis]CKI21609.1 Thioesterase [Mycolicibacterium smegmatis]
MASSDGTDRSAPHPRVVLADGVPMSALVAKAPEPRAVVVALHGGATTSAYFDCPGHPELSLLHAGVAAGFTVVALDRPGYGASAPYPEAMARPEQRLALVFGALERIVGTQDLFLLGHSVGCELAVRMAISGARVVGISLAGTGRRYQSAGRDILKNASSDHRPRGLRELLWEPARLYPPDVLGSGLSSGGAAYEGDVVKTWSWQDFPQLAALVKVPAQFIAGDHENVWEAGTDALAAIGAMFTASPRVDVEVLPESGHNLSVGHTAAEYHQRVLSFAAECLDVRATRAGTDVEVEAG